jgi:hypothetical protein
MRSVTILEGSRAFEFSSLLLLPVTSELSGGGGLGIPQMTMVTKVTIVTTETTVTRVACGFPIQSFPRAEIRVALHAKCPLMLSDFDHANGMECVNRL